MSTEKFLQRISIESPCSARWEEMSGNDQVRFCAHCNLSVRDLSQLTRSQAVKLVLRSQGRLCLRIQRTPSGEVITRPAAAKLHSISRRTARLAAGAFTAVLSVSSAAYAQSTSPSTGTATQKSDGPVAQEPAKRPAAAADSWLAGTVTDPNGGVIPKAKVTLTNEQTNAVQEAETDDAGEYRLRVSSGYTYAVAVESPGFSSLTTQHIVIKAAEENHVDVTLQVAALQGALVTIEYEDPLIKAVSEDDQDGIESALNQGANVNRAEGDDPTPLELAVGRGNVEIVRRLLVAGANTGYSDDKNQNVLFWLHDDSSPELVELLVNAGADVNQTDVDGNTPLLQAAESNDRALLQALIDAGAYVNAQNREGNSPVIMAAVNGNAETLKALLAAGASSGLRNARGEDALRIAEDNGNDEIGDILRGVGAAAADLK